MDFRILGPLEVHDGDRELPLGGGKQRALALLLVNANRTVSIDGIIDDLWDGSGPESAPKMVQIYVSKLRKMLAPGQLHTRPPGYSCSSSRTSSTSTGSRASWRRRAALDAGRAQQAADRLRHALALWRGPALAEFASEPFSPSTRVRGSRSSEWPRSNRDSRLTSRSAATAPS